MATSIGPKIGIDGEKEFRDALQNIIQQCKTLASEVEKVSTAYKKNADALKSNKEQQKALTEQIEKQKERIATLNEGYNAATEALGENDTKTLKWKETINKAETELDELKTKLTQVNQELAKDEVENATKKTELLSAEYEKASTALEKQKSALQQNANQHRILGQQIDAQKTKIAALKNAYEQSKAALGENANETLEWKTALTQAETELDNLTYKLEKLPTSLGVVGSTLKDVGNKITGVGTTLTASVTTPLVALGTKAITNYGNVDKTFRQVKATIGDVSNEKEFEQLWDTMMDEATKSVYDVQDAADALLNYAQAGYDATDCANMLHGAFALAAGTGTEMTTVTSGMATALKAFNADTQDATHYADVFARGQAQAKVTTTGLIDSLSYAAPVFNSLGYSIEDLVSAVGMMGDAGFEGSEAGAALRTGLMRLAAPTDKASALMEQLGLEASDVSEMFSEEEGSLEDCSATMEEFGLSAQTIFDSEGNIRSFSEVIANLGTAFEGLTQKEKMEALDKIFGKNRGSAWLALIDQGSDKFDRLSNNLQNCSGDADEMADALMSGVGGALETVSSNFDVFTATLGETLAPTAQKVADALNGLMDWYLSLDEETQNQIAQMGLVAAAVGPVLIVIGQLVKAIGNILTGIDAISKFKLLEKLTKIGTTLSPLVSKVVTFAKSIGTAFAGLSGGSGLTGFLTSLGGVAGIIGGAILAVKNFVTMFTEGFSAINEILMVVGTALAAIGAVILGAPALVAAAIAAIVAAVATAVILIKDNWNSIVEFFANLWETIKEGVGTAWQAICDTVTGAIETIKTTWQDVCNAISEFFAPVLAMMSENWNSFANLASAAFEFVAAIVQGGWDIICALFEVAASWISYWWTEFSTAASQYLNEWLTAVQEALSMAWEAIKAVFSPFIEWIKEQITLFVEWWNITVVEPFNEFVQWLSEKWQEVKDNISETLENIKQVVSDGWNSIKQAVSDALTQMWDNLSEHLEKARQWGIDLVNNMAEGIRSAASKIRDAASGIAGKIRSYIHFSEPDKGPLSDFHTYMPDMMNSLAKSMLANRGVVQNAALTVAGDIAAPLATTPSTSTTNVGGITIVVNGAEGQDVNELANVVMDKINMQFVRNRVAFG